jgi:chromosome partitioning protein
MRAIAIAANKGGSGKTTVAVNLAAAVAAAGRRVLVVDFDPQAGASAALGRTARQPTLAACLLGGEAEPSVWADLVPGLDLLPSDAQLAGLETRLPGRDAAWLLALRRARGPLWARYDFVFIDTAPGTGVLPLLALAAADEYVLTCPPSFLALRAIPAVIEAAARMSPGPALLGVVPTLVERRSRHQREVLEALEADFPGQLLTAIPKRIVLQDAALAGLPVNVFAPGSDAAAAFASLAEEVIKRARP